MTWKGWNQGHRRPKRRPLQSVGAPPGRPERLAQGAIHEIVTTICKINGINRQVKAIPK
jgi:hypothetical protein